MFIQRNLLDLPNVTSSPGSEGGVTHSGSLGGEMIGQCGPEVALANLSPRQAAAAGKLTSGTYGRRGSISSGSVALQLSLESRLRARMDLNGSGLFRLTWKVRDIGLGRQICALRASGRRTSGNGCGSWPTPNTVPWQTPTGQDASGGPRTPDPKRGAAPGNQAIAKLTSWATPAVHDAKGTDYNRYGEQGKGENRTHALQDQVQLASWATPQRHDGQGPKTPEQVEAMRAKGHGVCNLNEQAATISGPPAPGSPAGTGNSGQLNPAFPLWLMGYPGEYLSCAP